MDYTLRPYQQEAVNHAIDYFNNPKVNYNTILVLPTGSGKSLVIANIVKELNGNVLIFQPTKEILEQNYQKYISYGYKATIYSASVGQKIISKVTYATIGSVKNKAELFNKFNYIIVDECHFVNAKGGMYEKFLNSIECKKLGLTATPYRLSTDGWGGSILKFITRTRPRIFKNVLYYVQNKELFDTGYLAKLQYVNIDGFDTSKIKINSTGADFNEESLKNYYNIINHTSRIIRTIKDLQDKRRSILVFCSFVEECEYIKTQIDGAIVISAQTPKKERELINTDFRNGKIKVVLNVGIYTTGVDFPELDTVILGRPTMSLALYYQQIGRAIRPHPNKDYSLIVDLTDNFGKFGKIEDLVLNENKGKYFISNNERQLTNSYFQDDVKIDNEPKIYTMPFGKYKDKDIQEVPKDYLKWMNQNITLRGELKLQVAKILII